MKEIECLARLFKLTNCYEDFVDHLLDEKILSADRITDLKLELNKPKFLYETLKEAEKEDKLLLLSFDWALLPVERIRVRLVTTRNSRDFTYHY